MDAQFGYSDIFNEPQLNFQQPEVYLRLQLNILIIIIVFNFKCIGT